MKDWDTPLHFDRLRWWGMAEGSRGEVERMRAMPVLPVEMAWRWGRENGQEIAMIPVGALSAPPRSSPQSRGKQTDHLFRPLRTTRTTKPSPSTGEVTWPSMTSSISQYE